MNWQRLVYAPLLIICKCLFGQPTAPQSQPFQPINLQTGKSTSMLPLSTAPVNALLRNDPYKKQNSRFLQQSGMDMPGAPRNTQQNAAEANLLPKDEPGVAAKDINELRLRAYVSNFREFLQLNPDSFSITKAVYLSESAFYDNPPSFKDFAKSIHQGAEIVEQILKRESLSEKDNLAVNYAIQKLYSQQNQYYDSTTGRVYWINRVHYDWDDYMGDNDWTKMFVTKLLQTGSGQCHSLPLFYLCLAEQFHAKAYLSLAPNHSFVQFFDKDGKRYNFEATNGNLVTQTWLMQSTYVNATALKNETYLDTLSSRRLFAQCLSDFLLSYLMKMRHYDDFSELISKKIFQIDSLNLTALMERANRAYTIFVTVSRSVGNPSPNKYKEYPKLNQAYKELQECKKMVMQTGFQEMPTEAYRQWLQSLQGEKEKELNREEEERMQRAIIRLRKAGSTLNHKQN